MIIKWFLIIFVLLINSEYVKSQEISVEKNLILFNGPYGSSPELKKIEKVNYIFRGYLVIRMDSVEKRNSFYHCNIFWVDSLSKIDFDNSYKYYPFLSFWMGNNSSNKTRDSLEALGIIFSKVYTGINYDSNCQTYLFNSKDFIKTNILENVKLWTNGELNMAIFECSFRTAIVEAKIEMGNISENWRIFVPISKSYKLKEINETEASKFNLIKSDKTIKLVE